MKTSAHILLLFSLLGFFAFGCSSSDDGDLVDRSIDCSELAGKTYYSRALLDGEEMTHGYVTFDADNDVELSLPDQTISGSYECSNGNVSANFANQDEQMLSFSYDLNELQFQPKGDETVVYYSAPDAADDQAEACENVAGKNFMVDNLTVDLGDDVPVAAPVPFFYFDDDSTVDYSVDGAGISRGVYDCELGLLHIHRTSDDRNPVVVLLSDDSQTITVRVNNQPEAFSVQEEEFCTEVYQPVCSVDIHSVQCESEPCPLGTYQTYPNRCHSDAAGALFLYEGECGEQEGETYANYQDCGDVYTPVCAAAQANEPCDGIPCPAIIHETFDNNCEANAQHAHVLFEGECGDLEETPVENLQGGCAAVYAPVCAKDQSDACEGADCEEFVYQTFSNRCRANLDLATPVFEGECGNLEGVATNDEPPVHLVEELPEAGKEVAISDVVIMGDMLQVQLGYFGCNAQHFGLYVHMPIDNSGLVPEVATVFNPVVEDSCDAYFTTTFIYDLVPLKNQYQEQFESASGEIDLIGLGRYEF